MITLAIVAVLLSSSPQLAKIDAGTVELQTPEITKEDLFQYRKVKFSRLADIMTKNLGPSWTCIASYHEDTPGMDPLVFWQCLAPDETFYGTLFVYKKGEWTAVDGLFKL